MTIWASYVFAKPLGRCVQALQALQPPENIPAMNNLVQTLDEYLHATDSQARDVYRKAVGLPSGGAFPLTDTQAGDAAPAPAPLANEEIRAIAMATCGEQMVATHGEDLVRFARAIEAHVRIEGAGKP